MGDRRVDRCACRDMGGPFNEHGRFDTAFEHGEFSREDDALYWQSGYLQVVRAGDWKLQHEGRRNKNWLFNLAEDPTEQNNLAETRPKKLAELTALLEKHQAGRTPSLYPYSMESPIQIDKTLADDPAKDDIVAWWPN